jgi:hypothetical protein
MLGVRTAMASSNSDLARNSMTDLLGGAESSLSLRISDGARAVQRLKARLNEVISCTSEVAKNCGWRYLYD